MTIKTNLQHHDEIDVGESHVHFNKRNFSVPKAWLYLSLCQLVHKKSQFKEQ